MTFIDAFRAMHTPVHSDAEAMCHISDSIQGEDLQAVIDAGSSFVTKDTPINTMTCAWRMLFRIAILYSPQGSLSRVLHRLCALYDKGAHDRPALVAAAVVLHQAELRPGTCSASICALLDVSSGPCRIQPTHAFDHSLASRSRVTHRMVNALTSTVVEAKFVPRNIRTGTRAVQFKVVPVPIDGPDDFSATGPRTSTSDCMAPGPCVARSVQWACDHPAIRHCGEVEMPPGTSRPSLSIDGITARKAINESTAVYGNNSAKWRKLLGALCDAMMVSDSDYEDAASAVDVVMGADTSDHPCGSFKDVPCPASPCPTSCAPAPAPSGLTPRARYVSRLCHILCSESAWPSLHVDMEQLSQCAMPPWGIQIWMVSSAYETRSLFIVVCVVLWTLAGRTDEVTDLLIATIRALRINMVNAQGAIPTHVPLMLRFVHFVDALLHDDTHQQGACESVPTSVDSRMAHEDRNMSELYSEVEALLPPTQHPPPLVPSRLDATAGMPALHDLHPVASDARTVKLPAPFVGGGTSVNIDTMNRRVPRRRRARKGSASSAHLPPPQGPTSHGSNALRTRDVRDESRVTVAALRARGVSGDASPDARYIDPVIRLDDDSLQGVQRVLWDYYRLWDKADGVERDDALCSLQLEYVMSVAATRDLSDELVYVDLCVQGASLTSVGMGHVSGGVSRPLAPRRHENPRTETAGRSIVRYVLTTTGACMSLIGSRPKMTMIDVDGSHLRSLVAELSTPRVAVPVVSSLTSCTP